MSLADAIRTSDVLRFDEWTLNGVVVVVLCLLVIAAMVVILVQRLLQQQKGDADADTSVARPVLALLLVGTVTILATASLSLTADDQARSLLIGGVVSLASTAVAFYFSSKAATEARQDLLKATTGQAVPELKGRTLGDAHRLISKKGLVLDPLSETDPAAVIASQTPASGATVPAGTVVKVKFKDSTGSSTGTAKPPDDDDGHPAQHDEPNPPHGGGGAGHPKGEAKARTGAKETAEGHEPEKDEAEEKQAPPAARSRRPASGSAGGRAANAGDHPPEKPPE